MIWAFNLVAIVLIASIIWWFWLSKPKVKKISDGGPIEIIVENGVYTPSVIEGKKGQMLELVFLRKDPSPCAEKVVFDDFGLTQDLPLNQGARVSLTPDRVGNFDFTCQMAMYRGKLVVN